eukprot:scaffold31252_cov63-Phaeocystis_antarctica.AAC.6
MSCSSAGSAPLSSAAARAAQLASVIWVLPRLSSLSFASPTSVVGGGAPAGSGARRAARPASPSGLPKRPIISSAGSRRKAAARATSPASPMAALFSTRRLSRGMAPRPRAAASAEAPSLPTCMLLSFRKVTPGSAPAPSPSTSRCTPSGPANLSQRNSLSSAVAAPNLACPATLARPRRGPCRRLVHGGARLEHVAQLGEENALLVTAQLRQRHRGAARWGDNVRGLSQDTVVELGHRMRGVI